MPQEKSRVGCAILALALVLALGLAGLGWAQSTAAPQYPCSIKVPEPEPADLATLAKITPDQAKTAAQAARPHVQVKEVELGNENGCLVYEVEFVDGWEVKVDAGNGKVLHQEQKGKEGREKKEKER